MTVDDAMFFDRETGKLESVADMEATARFPHRAAVAAIDLTELVDAVMARVDYEEFLWTLTQENLRDIVRRHPHLGLCVRCLDKHDGECS